MSKFSEVVATCLEQSNELNLGLDEALITGVAKSLGPSIYNNDSARVSGSDKTELDRVKNNFLIGKLGLADDGSLDTALAEVISQLGSSNRNKWRVNVYALLAKKFGKEANYV